MYSLHLRFIIPPLNSNSVYVTYGLVVMYGFLLESLRVGCPRKRFGAKKLCQRGHCAFCITEAFSDYIFNVTNLRIGKSDDVQVTRPRFHSNSSLNTKFIISHVLSPVTVMSVFHLLRLAKNNGHLFMKVYRKFLRAKDGTPEPLQRVYKNFPRSGSNN